MSGSRSWLWAISLALAACTKPAEQQAAAPAVDSAAVIAAATNFWQRYGEAVLANDTTAIMGFVDDSARIDARGMPPLIGKAAVQAQFSPIWKVTKYTAFTVTPDMTIPVSNELVYQNGTYIEAMTANGKATTDYGRYASALVRGPDGQWRVGYIMAFADSIVAKK